MDKFKKKGLPYATPPPPGVRKDRGMTRRQRRRLARATVELAEEAQKDWLPITHPRKP